MNERIKKLAEQAGYYLYDLTETHECKTVETDNKDEWITLEKFAELIVKECLEIIDRRNGWINDENRDSQFVYGYETAVRHCSMFIKEYLGVRE
jgi:hypothetical protein